MEKKKESLLASVKKDKPEVYHLTKALKDRRFFLSKMVKRKRMEIKRENNIINRRNTLNKDTETRKFWKCLKNCK